MQAEIEEIREVNKRKKGERKMTVVEIKRREERDNDEEKSGSDAVRHSPLYTLQLDAF